MRGFGFQSPLTFYFDDVMEQRKPIRKMKIIAVSSIQHPTIECGAAGTCDGVTGTEDAGQLSDYVGYHGLLMLMGCLRG